MCDLKKKKMAFIDLTNFVDWPIGGMLSYELSILKYLVKKYDVDLWGVSVDGKINDYIEINGKQFKINVYANVNKKIKIIPNFWKGVGIAFSREFKKNKYDIIYAHSGSCMLGATLFKSKKETLLVYHQHGLSYLTNHSLMSYTQKPFYWYSQKISDIVFLVTDKKSAENYVNKLDNKKNTRFVSIGSPLDLSEFNNDRIYKRITSNDGKTVNSFIYVGRLSPEKNLSQMIEAYYIFKNKYKSNAVLHVIGDGPDRHALEELVCKFNLKNNVIFHGSRQHTYVLNLLEKSDAFLITSKGEGVSISVLEAYASGLPVVCFHVPGLEAQIIDGKTGKIAINRDTDSFVDAMKFVEDNKTDLSKNALEYVVQFDVEKISNLIINEIER